MDRREAYERRIWRLSFLLSAGDAASAAALTCDVARLRPDFISLEPARLDHLVLLEARRRTHSPTRPIELNAQTGSGRWTLAQAAGLPRQCFEAWLLFRVDGLDDVAVARAMDCSRTASARFLAQAEEALGNAISGDVSKAAELVRALADAVDPGVSLVAERRTREKHRRIRLAVWAMIALVVAIGLAVLAINFVLPSATRHASPSRPPAQSPSSDQR